MKKIFAVALVSTSLFAFGSRAADNKLIERSWVKVDENHAELEHAGRSYALDTYIVMFQQPYYIHVRATDKQALVSDELVDMASEYIKPRGCTQPLERRSDLDRSNAEGTELVLGFQC
ncbi:MAG: hypothetical protein ACN6RK_03920 [Stenotrophomonas sp.]|jgi:hypothetical protein